MAPRKTRAAKLGADAGAPAAPKKAKSSVVVFDKKTGVKREYSLAVHGKEFRALAEEFASKVSSREVIG